MALYTYDEVAALYGASYTTTWRHINALKKERKFKKTGKSQYFNDKDLQCLSEHLGFKIDQKKLEEIRKSARK